MEEAKGSIPFLSVYVKRGGSKLTTSVYRKPTHKDRYLPYIAHRHPKVKSGIVTVHVLGYLRHFHVWYCNQTHKRPPPRKSGSGNITTFCLTL